jgi:hypothetical protein
MKFTSSGWSLAHFIIFWVNLEVILFQVLEINQHIHTCIAMQFKEMIGVSLSADEKRVMENAKGHILDNQCELWPADSSEVRE